MKRFLLILAIACFTGLSRQNGAAINPPARKYKSYHANGQLSEKGKFDNDGIKFGTWNYYDSLGFEIRREKWKQGQLRWQLYLNKGRITKSIDRHGNIRHGADCACP
jgi:antitoxin component YwqK of YwqJK toxin-antitoxin module